MRRLMRGLGIGAIALFVLALLGAIPTGGYGMLRAPEHPPKFSLSVEVPASPSVKPPPEPCYDNVTPGPVHYDTSDASVVRNREFGKTLAPRALPPVKPRGYVPSGSVIRYVVCAEWNALRHRPQQALATATVALPQYRNYFGSSWPTQLGMLSDHGDWGNANLVFVNAQAPPPHPNTMGMNYATGPRAPPQVFMTNARTTGWYLTVPFGNYTLYLRVVCGGQPTFNLYTRYQALLRQYYPFFG